MDSMMYEHKLREYLKEESNRKYSVAILEELLSNRFRKGFYVIGRGSQAKRFTKEDLLQKPLEVVESLILRTKQEGYNSSVVPTMISADLAPNFRITEEKPKEEELWRFLFLLLSGLHYRKFVVNLDNLPAEIWSVFKEYLVNKKYLIFGGKIGLDVDKIFGELQFRMPMGDMKKFIFSFLVLTYFVKFLKEKPPEDLPPIGDEVVLVLFSLPRQKKEMYVFPRLSSLIRRWYGDFIRSYESSVPEVARFIFSLYIPDKQYKKKSAATLNKFLYYMLAGYVNGELLNKLVEDKISYELGRKGKPSSILSAKKFFSSLQLT